MNRLGKHLAAACLAAILTAGAASSGVAAQGPGGIPVPAKPIGVSAALGQGANAIALGARFTIRFTRPVSRGSLTDRTLGLIGPQGLTPARIDVDGGGASATLTPLQDLRPAASYQLFERGARGADGAPVAELRADFTTQTMRPASGAVRMRVPVPMQGQYSGIGLPDHGAPLGETWTPTRDNAHGNWRVNRRQAPLPDPLKDPDILRGHGRTVVFGQVRRLDDRPVVGADIAYADQHVRTDRQGRFVLLGLPLGQREIFVDGTAVATRGGHFGQFSVGVNVQQDRINAIPYPLYLPKVRADDEVALQSPTVGSIDITNPSLPGLKIRLPAGSVVRDHAGHVVDRVALVPVPLDRAPYPAPAGFPVYFSFQPGDATIEAPWGAGGVQVLYPNYSAAAAGTSGRFERYDPTSGWKSYAVGSVSADGAEVVASVDTGLYKMTGMSFQITGGVDGAEPAVNPQESQTGQDCSCAADPVDLATGAFYHSWTDFALNDRIPVVLSRTFRSGDTQQREFGIGMSSSLSMYLLNQAYVVINGVQQTGVSYDAIYLVLPDGEKIQFNRTAGNFGQGTWTAATTSSTFTGAKLTSVQDLRATQLTRLGSTNYYDVALKDGSHLYFYNELQNNALMAIGDRYGNLLQITRSGGQAQTVTGPSGRSLSFAYNGLGLVTSVTDHTGRSVSYAYTGGYLTSVTYPDSTSEHYAYDGSNNFSTIADRRGNVALTNAYDASGRVHTQTYADGGQFVFSYTQDGNGNPTETDVTAPNGVIRRVLFDSGWNITTDAYGYGTADAQTTSFTRDATGFITDATDSLGRTTHYARDNLGNLTSSTALFGTSEAVTASITYMANFNLPQVYTDPLGHTTSFGYDDKGCLTSVTDALSHSTSISCSSDGRPQSVTDALSHVTSFTYDGLDLAAVTDPMGRTVRYAHDALGRLTSTANPLGDVTLYGYDSMDRPATVTSPMGHQVAYGYDQNGNLTSITLPNGATIRWAYDTSDRVTSRTDALSHSESWTWNTSGQVTSHTDRKGQIAGIAYDDLGRPHVTTFADSSTITAAYDAGNRATIITDSVSGTIGRSYDGLDRLTQETSPQGTIGWVHDAAGRRTSMQVVGQSAVTYGWDNANRLTSITQGGQAPVSFGYDEANRRASLVLPNGIVTAYGYNSASQLTSLAYGNGLGGAIGDLEYGYDQGGRLSSIAGSMAPGSLDAATTSNAVYNPANQLTRWNGAPQTYDLNGSLVSDGSRAYNWDARNQLNGITQAGSPVATFSYDSAGRRVAAAAPGATGGYLYDGLNPVVDTLGGGSHFILNGFGIDERYARDEAGGRLYFLSDHLGSTLALIDTTQAIQKTYSYSPYGVATVGGSGSTTNPFTYTGRENDGTGDLYLRSRYMRTGSGSFIAEDRVGLLGGANSYAYVNDDPTLASDPTGTCGPFTPLCIAAWIFLTENSAAIGTAAIIAGEVATGTQTPLSAPASATATVAEEAGAVQIFENFPAAKAALGARVGQQLHHVVEQCQANVSRSGFALSKLNSTDNLMYLDKGVHQEISSLYSSILPGSSQTVRDTMNGQSFQAQYDFGRKVVDDILSRRTAP